MNAKHALSDFIDLMRDGSNYNKHELELFFKAFYGLLEEVLLEDKIVKIKGIGTFKLQPVENRKSVNINTGESVEIPAHYKVVFQPDKELNDQVNGVFSSFETIEVSDEQAQNIEAQVAQQTVSQSPIIEPEPTKDFHHKHRSHSSKRYRKRRSKVLVWVYCVAVAALVVMGGLTFYIWEQTSDFDAMPFNKPTEVRVTTSILQALEDADKSDSISSDEVEPIAEKPIATVKPATKNPQNDTPIKVVIQRGERLTMIAERHYGNKAFWGYIFDENKTKLLNPNNVPVGVQIVIPPQSKYNIDSSNPESIQKAKQRSEEILREHSKLRIEN